MSSHSTYDLDGQERIARASQARMKREARCYQHDLDMEIFRLEYRLGCYAKWQPRKPQPAPYWDGVKNSQIIPLSR